MTQTCIRFIHKTAWFPKTIQTACSSAGSWPWARGPRPKGTPPGTHPHWQGTTQRSPFFCRHQPGRKKKDSLSLREVATITIRAIETWAPQISTNKQTELSFLQNHYWGGGPHCGDGGCSTPGLGLGVGESSPSPSVSSSRQLCPRGWIQRGFNTAPSTFSL